MTTIKLINMKNVTFTLVSTKNFLVTSRLKIK